MGPVQRGGDGVGARGLAQNCLQLLPLADRISNHAGLQREQLRTQSSQREAVAAQPGIPDLQACQPVVRVSTPDREPEALMAPRRRGSWRLSLRDGFSSAGQHPGQQLRQSSHSRAGVAQLADGSG